MEQVMNKLEFLKEIEKIFPHTPLDVVTEILREHSDRQTYLPEEVEHITTTVVGLANDYEYMRWFKSVKSGLPMSCACMGGIVREPNRPCFCQLNGIAKSILRKLVNEGIV